MQSLAQTLLAKRRPAHGLGLMLSLIALILAGCGHEDELARSDAVSPRRAPASDGTFSVMTYNLGRYGYHDRTGDGQANNFKPDTEQEAVLAIITDVQPDILAIQEIGGPLVFADFREALAAAGLDYTFAELLQRDQSEMNLAVLSRYPFVSVVKHTNDTFSIGGESAVPVKRGFLEVDIAISPTYTFRLINAQLKSKTYHPLGHTEMRRSEARLLNNHVRSALRQSPRLNLLVVGDMNDHVRAAPLRTLMGANQEYLIDVRPRDSYGELWTFFDDEAEAYLRFDYMLLSPYMMPELIPARTKVVRHPLQAESGARRPLVAVFQSRDVTPADTPLLPPYEEEDY